jgi:hypothetical protein
MAFAIVRTQAPHRHSQPRFLGVQVFRVGGRKTCGQRFTVATSENADVDARRQLLSPVVLPHFRMLPDCLIKFVPGLGFHRRRIQLSDFQGWVRTPCRRSAAITRAPNARLRMPPSSPP